MSGDLAHHLVQDFVERRARLLVMPSHFYDLFLDLVESLLEAVELEGWNLLLSEPSECALEL